MDATVLYLIHSLKEEKIYLKNQIQYKESYILRLITLAYLTDKALRVSELLDNQDLGSRPTIQTYITHLVQKQFVVRKVNDVDGRVQLLIPTDSAVNLFRRLGDALYDEKVSGIP